MAGDDRAATLQAFGDTVNMAPAQLTRWLATPASREVGFTPAGKQESVGHRSGERIVDILRKERAHLDEDDYTHMKKVAGYVHRHLAQRPAGNVSDTRWRHSLMNWGHDPLQR
ncbi:MAG: DUF3140 domain-containing protein [Rubrivivax sp.]|nr:DUF3140 domain-containing protein [Rubrivivax sp.]